MVLDKIALEICFELNNDPKNFKLTDTTDYASESIALTDVEGLFKITAPDGTIAYENAGFASDDFTSPDVDVDVSTLFDTVNLPLDSENEVQLGNYLIEYKIEVIGVEQPGIYLKSFSVENCHVDPIVDVDFITDCFNSKLTSTDNTDYSTELVPSPTSIVRTHTAYPPPTSGLSDTVTPNKILVASPISTKTWTLEVSSVVRWDYPDGLCIINTLVGDIEAEVTCDVSICDIFCCIDKLYNRYISKLGINSVLANEIKAQLDTVSLLLVLFENALKCGHNDKAQIYYDTILKVSGCEPGCSCTDVDTVQVIPVCVIAGTAVVDACGNGAITVTPNTLGNTTTYTVCFDQDLLDKLNALASPVTPLKDFTITEPRNGASAAPRALLGDAAGGYSNTFEIEVDRIGFTEGFEITVQGLGGGALPGTNFGFGNTANLDGTAAVPAGNPTINQFESTNGLSNYINFIWDSGTIAAGTESVELVYTPNPATGVLPRIRRVGIIVS